MKAFTDLLFHGTVPPVFIMAFFVADMFWKIGLERRITKLERELKRNG